MNKFLSSASAYLSPDAFRIPPAVFVLLVTLFSFSWILGYEVYEGDQLIYFPELLKRFDPALFPRDLIFSQDGFTFFDDAILAGIRILRLDIFSVLFFMVLVLRFVYFWGVYKIFKNLTGSRILSLLAPLLYLSAFVVYGTGMRTIAPMLLPRDIAIAFGLCALGYLLERRFFIAALLLGFGILFHPATSLPFLFLFYAMLFFDGYFRPAYRVALVYLAPLFSFFILYLFIPPGEGGSLFQIFDPAWREVILGRDSYYFLSTWYFPNTSPVYLAASIYIFFLLKRELMDSMGDARKRTFFLLCVFIPAGLSVISLILADWFGLALVTQLSLGRSLLLWKIFLNGLFAYYAIRHIVSHPRDLFYNFLLSSIVFSFAVNEKLMFLFLPAQVYMWAFRVYGNWLGVRFLRLAQNQVFAVVVFLLTAPIVSYVWLRNSAEGFSQSLLLVIIFAFASAWCGFFWRSFEKYKGAVLPVAACILLGGIIIGSFRFSISPGVLSNALFLEACEWIKARTQKDAIFITEPFSSRGGDIRLFCERGLFATRKDGGQVIFDRDFALEWQRRYAAIKAMKEDPARLDDVSSRYPVDYVFSESDLERPGKAFDNGVYRIYSLR